MWGGVHDRRINRGNVACIILLVQYLIKDCFPVDFRIIWLEPMTLIMIGSLFYENKIYRVLNRKCLVWLGNISTEIFLCHYCVIHFVDKVMSKATNEIQFCLMLTLTIVLSYFVHCYRERNLL